MQIFRVALLQMTAGSSQEENRRKGLDWCRRAKAMGADLALFPEMWNTGYAMTEDCLLYTSNKNGGYNKIIGRQDDIR